MKKFTYFMCLLVLGVFMVLGSPAYRGLPIADGLKAIAQDFKTVILETGGTAWAPKTILQGTTSTSDPIDVSKILGYISLQLKAGNATQVGTITGTGNGTLTVKFQVSNDGQTFVDPPDIDNTIVSAFTYNSGDGSDGDALYPVSPPSCKYIRFTAQNTAGSGNITLRADANMH